MRKVNRKENRSTENNEESIDKEDDFNRNIYINKSKSTTENFRHNR